jgi:hypothetical protein
MTADRRTPAAAAQQETEGRLAHALAEQSRLGEAYQRSAGTSSEMASYMRLRAAGRRVVSCHVRATGRGPERERDRS